MIIANIGLQNSTVGSIKVKNSLNTIKFWYTSYTRISIVISLVKMETLIYNNMFIYNSL